MRMQQTLQVLSYFGVSIFIIGAYAVHYGLGLMVTGVSFVLMSSYYSVPEPPTPERKSQGDV